MEPLGTITKYFPFFNSETRKTLESLMDDSLNYADFAEKLCEYVCLNEVPEFLVYYAMNRARNTQNGNALRKIIAKHTGMPLVDLYSLEVHKKLDAINSILEANPEDWIKFDLYSQKLMLALTHSLGSTLEKRALEEMELLIQKNNQLKSFEPILLFSRAYLHYHDENRDEALECLESALRIAKEYDDRLAEADILWHIVVNMRNVPNERLLILSEIKRIIKELGFLERKCDLWNLHGGLHRSRGEFTATIKCYLKCIQCMQSVNPKTTGRFIPNNLALTNNLISDGEEALEWARMSIEAKSFTSMNPSLRANSYLNMARALIILERLDEAEYFLDIGRKLTMDVGINRALARTYVVTGLLERARGDIQTALQTIEQGLKIWKGKNRQFPNIEILYSLAETEIMLFTHYDDQNQDDVGPWLTLFETEARERDCPGYIGLALLLKAQLRLNQSRVSDAYNMLDEAIDISKNPETKFLEKKIAKLILTAFPEQS